MPKDTVRSDGAQVQESRWVDLSSQIDKASNCRRFVKTLGLEGGFGRVARIEIVGNGAASPPPDEVLTYAFHEWMRGAKK